MRVTISLDDAVHQDAKVFAAKSGLTLSRFVEDALRAALARGDLRAREPVDLPVWTGSTVNPRFDEADPGTWADFLDQIEREEIDTGPDRATA